MKKEVKKREYTPKKQKAMLLGLGKKYKQDSQDSYNQKIHQTTTKSSQIHTQESVDRGELQPIAKVAIMGRPNVGKSSLFNRLNQKNIAITSHMSGSTRDINKRDLRLHNFDITLIDTGGLEVLAHKLKEFYKQNNATQTTSQHQSIREYAKGDLHGINRSNPRQQALIAAQLKESIAYHSYQVVATSDIIIYMVDGSSIVADEDIKIFRELSKQKPLLLVLNKVDSDKIALQASEFVSFGVPYITISVAHNRGITKLLARIEEMIQSLIDSQKLYFKPKISQEKPQELDFLDYFDDEEHIVSFDESSDELEQEPQDLEATMQQEHIAVGIIGRPNVGKSSLLNALTNDNRALVSDIAGTTIDPVDAYITHENYRITFIDTAGIRRRSKIEGIEKYALDRTQKIDRKSVV